MQELTNIINSILGVVWSSALVYLCLGAGLLYSILTRFAQVRHFGNMIQLLFNGKKSKEGISSFQALSVALSGRVGTGNIAGVAAAIGIGGPGAIFWMWVVAFLGASTAYIESTLGQIYKEIDDNGQYRGGPAYYFEKCLGQKWYGILFAISSIIACGLFLPGVQANSVGQAAVNVFGMGDIIHTSLGDFGTHQLIALLVVVVILSFIIFGGIKRIANFAEVVVPFMALAYMMLAIIIIALNITELPNIISMIFTDAFTPIAGLGAAVGIGVQRGVYSNEAGQGNGVHAAAAAEVDHPAQQGLVQAFSVYIDTLFVCSATAFMILITGAYNVAGPDGTLIIQNLPADTVASSPAFTQEAVSRVFGTLGKPFVAIALFFFAFTTILAYYYIAETNVYYIRRFIKARALTFFVKVAILLAVIYGTLIQPGAIWGIGDIGVGLMAWLNIVGILFILFFGRPAMKALRDYERQQKEGVKDYTFDPIKLGIKNAHFWENRINNKK